MKQIKIGFIGVGNMGGSLASAISRYDGAKISVFDKDINKCVALKDKCHLTVADMSIVAGSDFLFLGVKPAAVFDLCRELSSVLGSNTTLISMAAGVDIASLQECLPEGTPIIRIMPNTPVAVGQGMTVYAASAEVSPGIERDFCAFMSKTGALDKQSECLIDAACAVQGCGPAFAYMFIDAIAKGGARCGIDYKTALRYACKTVAGACAMIEESAISPEQLRQEVCSPGGSTIEGVKALFAADLEGTCISAVKASFERTKELGKKK